MRRPFRSFAIVPAAGASRRMGSDKLLLQWGDRTIIEHVLGAWKASRVDHVVVVVRPDLLRLAELGQAMGVEVVVPDAAPDEMKDSVCLAIEHVHERHAPRPTDAWLLAPADMPLLRPQVIDRLLTAYDPSAPATLAPTFSGKSGHPILLPWKRAFEVEALPPDRGVDALISGGELIKISVGDAGITADLDTPEDFRWLGEPRGTA